MADEYDNRSRWCYLLGTLALVIAIVALVEIALTTAGAPASDPVRDNGLASYQMPQDVYLDSTTPVYISRLVSTGRVAGYPCDGSGVPCGQGYLPYFRTQNDTETGYIDQIMGNSFSPNHQTPAGVRP
jgi:hypothetical protein